MVLERTAQESERLNHLINNILATSRMEKTGFELYLEQVNLSAQITGLISKYELLIPQNISFNYTGEIYANVDILSFELIIQNLIENASKYSEKDTEISLSLREEKGQIELAVADVGIGISDKEKTKVLNKFYRVGNEGTRKSKGTGLGLYLVSSLVTEMNGKLTISDNLPQGCIFKIEVPTGN